MCIHQRSIRPIFDNETTTMMMMMMMIMMTLMMAIIDDISTMTIITITITIMMTMAMMEKVVTKRMVSIVTTMLVIPIAIKKKSVINFLLKPIWKSRPHRIWKKPRHRVPFYLFVTSMEIPMGVVIIHPTLPGPETNSFETHGFGEL